MNHIKIKSLSVNNAWAGRRFKTPAYKSYETEMFYLLPKIKVPKGSLKLTVTFGFSNSVSDIDNPLKPFIDILQKKYDFNDKQIYHLEIFKIIVDKGEEFIAFSIDKYN